jgi:adenosine deaminase
MRAPHDLSDVQLADLAAMSIRASQAPDDTKAGLLREVKEWLAE